MKKTILLSVLAVLCLNFPSKAQKGIQIKRLLVGSKIPDVTLNNVLKYSSASLSTSDFRNKLLIIDYMNTSCGSCIEALPRFEEIKKKYTDQVEFLIVTNERGVRVSSFLKTNSILKKTSFPVAFADTSLLSLFPHRYVSHVAWVNRGVVSAITGSEYVTAENIKLLLSGQALSLPVKTDVNYNYKLPFMAYHGQTGDPGELPKQLYYTGFREHLNGVAAYRTEKTDTVAHSRRITYINYSPVDLYLSLLNETENFPSSHVKLEIKHPENIFYGLRTGYLTEWDELHTFCYEAVLPDKMSKPEISFKIRRDVDFYTHLRSELTERTISCYQLVPESSSVPAADIRQDSTDSELIEFATVGDLLKILNDRMIGAPLFSELPNEMRIKVSIPENKLTDINYLNTALHQIHFRLMLIDKSYKILILKDEPAFNTPKS
ncbi:MAG: hypothetical protein JWM28_2186 [Chitinophagaceae bacterium]|nr:hypothetical protein [Chitinophagaceae bacterium]